MKTVSFIICPDRDRNITVEKTIKHIMENVPQISVPDAEISTIPLAALTLAEDRSKHCIEGYAEGKTWIDGKCTEYEINLVFG